MRICQLPVAPALLVGLCKMHLGLSQPISQNQTTGYKSPAFRSYSLFEDKDLSGLCCLWRQMFLGHYASEDVFFCHDAFDDSFIWYFHALHQSSASGTEQRQDWIQFRALKHSWPLYVTAVSPSLFFVFWVCQHQQQNQSLSLLVAAKKEID